MKVCGRIDAWSRENRRIENLRLENERRRPSNFALSGLELVPINTGGLTVKAKAPFGELDLTVQDVQKLIPWLVESFGCELPAEVLDGKLAALEHFARRTRQFFRGMLSGLPEGDARTSIVAAIELVDQMIGPDVTAEGTPSGSSERPAGTDGTSAPVEGQADRSELQLAAAGGSPA